MARPKSKPKPYAECRGEEGEGRFPWRVRWPKPLGADGKQHWDSASGFATRDDAIAHGWAQMTDIARGVWVDPRKAGVPFGEVADTWLRENPKAPKTDEGRRYLLRAVIGPRWHHVPIGQITWYEVKTWANNLAIPKVTVDRSVTLMSTILTAATDAKMIGANPLLGRRRGASNVKTPINLPPKPVVWPQPEQGAAIAARMGRVEGLMQITQSYLGLRWGELAAVHRHDSFAVRADVVDGALWRRQVLLVPEDEGALEDAEIIVTNTDGTETTARIHQLASPKTTSAVREVDVPPFLTALFAAHHATWDYDRSFASRGGGLRWLSTYNDQLAAAGAGWSESPKRRGTAGRAAAAPILPGLSSHGNRHAQATWMEEDGLSSILRDAIMGHATRGIGGVYAHPTPAMRKARVEALQRRWERRGVHDVYHAGPQAIRVVRRRAEGLRVQAPQTMIIPIPLPKQGVMVATSQERAKVRAYE